jgi:hypothetical protein
MVAYLMAESTMAKEPGVATTTPAPSVARKSGGLGSRRIRLLSTPKHAAVIATRATAVLRVAISEISRDARGSRATVSTTGQRPRARTPTADFCVATRRAMISVTRGLVIDLTGGDIDSAGQEHVMATPSMGPGSALPPSEWHSSAHPYTRSQLMACLRAGVIALVLLGILALIVLF